MLAAEELSPAISDCLDQLSPRCRAVLQLSLEGLTLEEIAQVYKAPYGTAGRLLHEARTRLFRCLGHKGFRFVPKGTQLPVLEDITILMRFPSELLVHFDQPKLQSHGYRFLQRDAPLPSAVGFKVVYHLPEDTLVYFDTQLLEAQGYRFVPINTPLPVGAAIVLRFEADVLIQFKCPLEG
jgi:Sigma-70, region 4